MDVEIIVKRPDGSLSGSVIVRTSGQVTTKYDDPEVADRLREGLKIATDTLSVRETQVVELKRLLAEQTKRADDNREWAERAEARVSSASARSALAVDQKKLIGDQSKLLEGFSTRAHRAVEILSADEVRRAGKGVATPHGVALVRAIEEALNELDA